MDPVWKHTLEKALQKPIDPFYEAFCSRHESRDIQHFVGYLLALGEIDEATFRQIGQNLLWDGPTSVGASYALDDTADPSELSSAGKLLSSVEIHLGREEAKPLAPKATFAIDTKSLPKITDAESLGEETTLVAQGSESPASNDPGSPPSGASTASAASASLHVRAFVKAAQAFFQRRSQGSGVKDFALRYGLGETLGRGGAGWVRVAHDQTLGRKVAFKSLLAKASREKEIIRRFWREAQVTAQLDHPNIVPIYDIEISPDEMPGYTMKWVQGKTFKAYLTETHAFLQRNEPLPESHQLKNRLEAFLKVCEAIAYAHSKGVIHRDLKPGNLMLGDFGQVYVMDWGLARILGEKDIGDPGKATLASDQSIDQTLPGQILGTPQYMSPEQASGQHDDLDGRSDIYALGLILFELLSLRPAIRGGSLPDVIISAIEGKVEDLRPAFEREPIPPALRAITLKAIRLHPDDRYPHAEALAADIRRFLRGEPTEALPEGWAQTLSRWLFRHRFPVLVSFLSILLLAVSVALGSLVHQSRISERAFFREREISRFLTRVSLQANRVENHLLQYEILLGEIASAASLALESGHPSPDPFFDSRTFSDPSTPPDRTPHPIYKTDVSFAHPVWHRSPGLPSDDATDPIRRLLPLRPRLFRIFFPDGDLPFPLSSPPRVSADAIPLGWVTLGLENGLAMIYPGRSGLPASYDPRTRPWYRQAVTKRGTVWGAPYLDALKADTYVPCSTALRSSKRDLLGVVGLDLRLSFLRSRLLPLRSQRGLQEIALLDHEGQILSRHDPHIPRPARLPPPARTTSESRKRLDVKRVSQRRRIILREPPTTESAALAPATAEGTTLESYPSRLVLDAIRSKRSGWLETPDSPKQAATLIAFYRLEALGWYYVAVVDRKALLRPLKTP